MFNFFKRLFRTREKPLVLTNPIKYEDEVKVTERPAKPLPTTPQTKPVAKKATSPKKPVVNKTATKTPTVVKSAELEKMTKVELDEYAEKNFGIKLDRRKRKFDMIADFLEQKRSKKQK